MIKVVVSFGTHKRMPYNLYKDVDQLNVFIFAKGL